MADKRNRGRRITDRMIEAYYELMKIVAENNHERMFELPSLCSVADGQARMPAITGRIFEPEPGRIARGYTISVRESPFSFPPAPSPEAIKRVCEAIQGVPSLRPYRSLSRPVFRR